MAYFKDVGYLLKQKSELDSMNRPRYSYDEILFYCNEMSIGQSEFYQSASVGLKPEIKLKTKLIDLSGITHIKYNSKVYKILRTFKKEDEIEITLTSLINESGD